MNKCLNEILNDIFKEILGKNLEIPESFTEDHRIKINLKGKKYNLTEIKKELKKQLSSKIIDFKTIINGETISSKKVGYKKIKYKSFENFALCELYINSEVTAEDIQEDKKYVGNSNYDKNDSYYIYFEEIEETDKKSNEIDYFIY